MKIMNVVGARPNFMKVAPIIEEIKKYPMELTQILVHTGQHYDREMSDTFFEDLNLPEPEYYLGVGSGSHAKQTAQIMVKFEDVLMREQPDVVILVGDVNSTLACSIVAAKIEYPNGNETKGYNQRRPLIAHVEAGLRSFDRGMSEEINRIVTDSLSDFLFTTSLDANENLIKEGVNPEKIFFVGNVMIDTLLKYRDKAKESFILGNLGLGAKGEDGSWKLWKTYAVLTLHRPSNVDCKASLSEILEALTEVGKCIPIIFPVHPRTGKRIEAFGFEDYIKKISKHNPIWSNGVIHCIDPLSYIDFLQLVVHSKLVFTDSGGVQEETTVLGIPCITLRENTERPVTIWEGTNILAGTKKDNIVNASFDVLLGGERSNRIPKLWDGRAAQRIVNILRDYLRID